MKDLITELQAELEDESDFFIEIIEQLAEIQDSAIWSRLRFLKTLAYLSSVNNEDEIRENLKTMGEEVVDLYNDIKRFSYRKMRLPEHFNVDDPENPICDYENLYFSRKNED